MRNAGPIRGQKKYFKNYIIIPNIMVPKKTTAFQFGLLSSTFEVNVGENDRADSAP